MIQLQPLLHDARSTVQGLAALYRHGATADNVATAISLFAARAPVVQRGQIVQYDLVLANRAAAAVWTRLLIDLYWQADQSDPAGHYAYFSQRVHVPSGTSLALEVRYDWAGTAAFTLHGVALPPVDFWRGECARPGRYVVKSLLLNDDGQPYQELSVVQEMQP